MSRKNTVSFKPKQVVKKLLTVLNERARDVIVGRYGLGTSTKKETLESIGGKYGITRERVRQIENHALATIRKSEDFGKEKASFEEIRTLIHSLGCLVAEEDLLAHVSSDQNVRNAIHFMLVLGDAFIHEKEDEHFKKHWCIDADLSGKIKGSLKKIYESLSDDDLISDPDMVKSFLGYIEDVSDEFKSEEIVKRWLSVSKKIKKNPLGEWGKTESPNVSAKGIRDYAYLVLRRHGSPIHFREVAKAIEGVFGKKAHIATTHNELIKDKRFVLVGRGLYALTEWGYARGVVKDVIRDVIEKSGPLSKKEVIEKVLKERYVKENTILVNLQNPKYFKRQKDGTYTVIK